jgi:hypothetical protein
VSGTEIVGYAASALVVASLAMTSVVRLRAISLLGSVVFVVYGALLPSVPIVLTNGAIAALNVWFLSRELGGKRDLGAVVVPADSPFLADFLRHHAADIRTFQPDFDLDATADLSLVLMRDGLPAGVVRGDVEGATLHLTLDYVLRAYRDSRLGQWLFGRGSGVLRNAGVDIVVATGYTDLHCSYLRRMGFNSTEDGATFVRTL